LKSPKPVSGFSDLGLERGELHRHGWFSVADGKVVRGRKSRIFEGYGPRIQVGKEKDPREESAGEAGNAGFASGGKQGPCGIFATEKKCRQALRVEKKTGK